MSLPSNAPPGIVLLCLVLPTNDLNTTRGFSASANSAFIIPKLLNMYKTKLFNYFGRQVSMEIIYVFI